MLRRKWVGWSAMCALALCAPVSSAAPHWGVPAQYEIVDTRDVTDVVPDAQEQPQLVRARRLAPPGFEYPGSRAAVDRSGDLVEFFSAPAPQLIYTPAGGAAQRTPVTTGLTRDLATAVAIDADGNAIAAWTGQTGATYTSSRPTATGVWEAPALVTAEGADRRFIALTPNGGALMVWTKLVEATDADGPTRTVLRSVYRAGPAEPWASPVTVRDLAITNSSELDPVAGISLINVAVDARDTALIAWLESPSEASPTTIHTAVLPAGASNAQADPVVAPPVDFFDEAQMAMAPDGAAVLALLQGLAPTHGRLPIKVWRRTANGPWIAAGPIPAERPASAFGFGNVASLRVAVSRGGYVAVIAARLPDPGHFPSSRNPLLWVPMGTSAPPGGAFTPMVDLDRPLARYMRVATSVGVGPDGRVLATWTLNEGFSGQAFTLRVAEYSDAAPAQPEAGPLEVRAISPPRRPTSVGSWAWLRLTLSRPVEDANAVITERRVGRTVVVGRWRVSGKVVMVPLRIVTAGRRTYRVRVTIAGHTARSGPVTVRGRRESRPLIAVSDALYDLASDRQRVWVLTGHRTRDGADRVRAFDATRGRPVGPGVRVTGAQAVTAGDGIGWVLGARAVTVVRPGRPTVKVPLKTPTLLPVDIAAESPTSAWVVLLDDAARRRGALVRVDSRLGRVTRRIALPSYLSFFPLGSLAVVSGKLVLMSAFLGQPSVAINLTTGRVTVDQESSVSGFGQTWSLSNTRGALRTAPRTDTPVDLTDLETDGQTPFSAAVGPSGLWLTTVNAFEALFGDNQLRVQLRLLRPGFRLASRPVVDVLPAQQAPIEPLFKTLAPVPGGVWVSLPAHGVLARVDDAEARVR